MRPHRKRKSSQQLGPIKTQISPQKTFFVVMGVQTVVAIATLSQRCIAQNFVAAAQHSVRRDFDLKSLF